MYWTWPTGCVWVSEWIREKEGKVEGKGGALLEVLVYIYIYYIHPELRMSNRPSGTGKGEGPLWREQRGSTGEHYGAV